MSSTKTPRGKRMARPRKADGIESLVAKQDPISIQEITLLDWFAGFAMIGASNMASPEEAAKEAFDRAEAALKERKERM